MRRKTTASASKDVAGGAVILSNGAAGALDGSAPAAHSGCVISEATIHEASRLLHEAAPMGRILLFGSYARGDARPSSDVDFLIIQPDPVDRRAEMVRLRRVLQPLRIPVDVVVVTEKDVDDWGHLPGTALYPALREGKQLHGPA